MTPSTTISHEHPTQRLQRSLFGFALLASLIGIITWIALLLSQPSPDTGFEQIRQFIVVGFAVAIVGMIGLTVWLFRASDSALANISSRLYRWLRRWPAAMILAVLLLQLNLALSPALRDVAPSIVGPMRFAVAGWSIVITMAIATLHWDRLRQFFKATASTWASVGFSIVLLVMVGGMFIVTALVVQNSGINDRLRGGLDYRELDFIDDGNVPSSSIFWQEQSKTRVRWQPYVYWVVDAIDGDFIHVSADGLRRTYTPPTVPEDAPVIAVYGGSTAWGEGSRDRYTIPSQIAALMEENGSAVHVINYAQTGYVSTQDMLTFQLQVINGRTPDVAVFYGGFNDLLSAYDQGQSGLTMQESLRLSDSEAGRALRSGLPLFRPLNLPLASVDFSLISAPDATAEAIVDRYLANVRLITQIASANGVAVLFVWQPSIVFKENLVDGEVGAYTTMQTNRPGFDALYEAAHAALVERLRNATDLPPFLMIHDLFNGDERAIFYDLIHITEKGNRTVAQRITEALIALNQ